MTSRTITSRPFDSVYDPEYYVSSGRDHNRTLHRTQAAATETVPETVNMFSELSHHPRATQRLARRDVLPSSIARDDQQNTRRAQAARDYNAVQPDGRDLIRFVGQAFVAAPSTSFNTALLKLDEPHVEAQEQHELPPGTMVTTSMQTDYRESETQTDPWTPEYVVRPGSAPEVLTLATLSYGYGLPAGLAEVEMIERARARRAWEATLPPAEDPYASVERAKAQELQELKELKFREQEIQRVQDERLNVLRTLIVDLEEKKHQSREYALFAADGF